jgi:hypothetical protein
LVFFPLKPFLRSSCVPAFLFSLSPAVAHAAKNDEQPAEPEVHITWPWVAAQLVPSPELAVGDGRARFGVRWQVTPVLWSWGIHRGLSPWRFFIAEPFVRQAGSVELFLSPEYFVYGPRFVNGMAGRAGVRAYFPLIERGEYLSVSAGGSYLYFDGDSSAAVEAGAYTLFGIVGAQLTWSPNPSASPIAWIATLRLRYF